MLRTLSIRNILLIERLDLEFGSGLGALTGETGSGKSILLDALSLTIGARADNELIRQGADQSMVIAEFELSDNTIINGILSEYGIKTEKNFFLRRVISKDGPSRAFIDDQPVSVALLRQIGGMLVEIHGQFETHCLLDPATHRGLVDSYGGHDDFLGSVSESFRKWRAAIDDHEKANKDIEKTAIEEEFLQHTIAEIQALELVPNEEQELAKKRKLLMNSEKIAGTVQEIFSEIHHGTNIESSLHKVVQKVSKIADQTDGEFDDALKSLERALLETNEGIAELERLSAVINLDPMELERVEERLFRIRSLARKHNVKVEELPLLLAEVTEQLSMLTHNIDNLANLLKKVEESKTSYRAAAKKLSKARGEVTGKLDKSVMVELAPLKLDTVIFNTCVKKLDENDWNEFGTETLHFEVQTNPNTLSGPIQKVASGGELARITLALKVVLAHAYAIPTIIFDEVDAGIGGAAAAAVGDRLSSLAEEAQVLVVTHSPQVAARGDSHFYISKSPDKTGNITQVHELYGDVRKEEIARMLSGAKITEEARAAAESLLNVNGWSEFAQ